ncbi:MAG TPA: pyridoxamine 5'-phosphate oxidase [Sphingomicrobium sp.]|nr:pyridoxamine 5'-phosphate oxidase [Sphingomicrobium sp.]
MATTPFELFDEWFASAQASEPNDPEAMALATASPDGQPHVRMVLLKGHSPAGFIFYTNEESAKGSEIADNAKAALLFHWKSLRRQVRIEGSIERVASDIADTYFASRARESQLGAWASDQSRPLDSRSTFERRFEEMRLQFDGRDVPRPPHWGGYLVVPGRIEFWKDRPHRLHERRLFIRDDDGWNEGLLYP